MPIKVSKKRDYRPHSEAMHGANVLLELSAEKREGFYYEWMGSLLLCAFAYEGYLNFLGRVLFPSWEEFERQLSWQSKTKLLADRLSAKIDEGKEPFQTIRLLFKFRDRIAHPKPKELEEEYETTSEELASNLYQVTKSEEEIFCCEANAKLCIERTNEMMRFLFEHAEKTHRKEKPEKDWNAFILNAPFVSGGQSGSAGSA